MKLQIDLARQVDQRVPYPYYVLNNGDVDCQDLWRGDPAALVGFQDQPDVQRVNLFFKDWWRDPQCAVGKYPVFVTDLGTVWVLKIEVVKVTVVDQVHNNVRGWVVTGRTGRGDYDADIGTSVVSDLDTRHDLATVNVFISPDDGAVVVDVDEAQPGVQLRVNINEDTIYNHTIPD